MRTALLPLLLPAVLVAACTDPLAVPTGPPSAGPPDSSTPADSGGSSGPTLPDPSGTAGPYGFATATFLPYTAGATAITYDPAVVPPGATAQLTVRPRPGGVTVRLAAAGLIPRRAYGAHLHTRPCSAAPDAAGPHYQHRRDPKTPSVDPAYANPRNEVWLDFTADAAGRATVTAEHPAFDPAAPPMSLVVHTSRTRTTAGEAGTAGARVACLTVTT